MHTLNIEAGWSERTTVAYMSTQPSKLWKTLCVGCGPYGLLLLLDNKKLYKWISVKSKYDNPISSSNTIIESKTILCFFWWNIHHKNMIF